MSKQVRAAVIGTGGMARYAHLRVMLQQPETTEIVVVCEPSDESYAAASVLFDEAGVAPPPNEPDLEKLLADYGERLDVALIITPHNLHYTQSVMCMEAGLDVLVEKPMVMNADEAERLIITRNRTGRLVVVAFNGSMSPNNRTAIKMMRNGEIGALQSIAATVWQNWSALTVGSWRQIPDISGGGFLFDTGAHMLNTVVDLAGEPFTEVSAFLDNCDRPVDINGVVMGRLKSGVLVTLHGCGDSAVSASDVRVFGTKAMLRLGVWGERLEAQFAGEDELTKVDVPESLGTWQQFVAVRNGEIDNPCPPEVGLRMAKLWDAIKESSAQGGRQIRM